MRSQDWLGLSGVGSGKRAAGGGLASSGCGAGDCGHERTLTKDPRRAALGGPICPAWSLHWRQGVGPGDQGGAAALVLEGQWWLEPGRVWAESSGWPQRCLPAHKAGGCWLTVRWAERGSPRGQGQGLDGGDPQPGRDAAEFLQEEQVRGQRQAQGWAGWVLSTHPASPSAPPGALTGSGLWHQPQEPQRPPRPVSDAGISGPTTPLASCHSVGERNI